MIVWALTDERVGGNNQSIAVKPIKNNGDIYQKLSGNDYWCVCVYVCICTHAL